MIVVWFKNGYRGRPTSNSLTDHREHLIWTPSRKRGVRWKGQFRKPDLYSLPKIAMSYGPACQKRGMKLLRLRVTFDPWHDKWNQRSKQKGSGILIKGVNFCKKPFQGLKYQFLFSMNRSDSSPVPVPGRSTVPRLLRLWVQIPPVA